MLSATDEAQWLGTPITRTTGMTASFGKRVCTVVAPVACSEVADRPWLVCVSSLVIDEIKRIVKSSEIMKFVACHRDSGRRFADA